MVWPFSVWTKKNADAGIDDIQSKSLETPAHIEMYDKETPYKPTILTLPYDYTQKRFENWQDRDDAAFEYQHTWAQITRDIDDICRIETSEVQRTQWSSHFKITIGMLQLYLSTGRALDESVISSKHFVVNLAANNVCIFDLHLYYGSLISTNTSIGRNFDDSYPRIYRPGDWIEQLHNYAETSRQEKKERDTIEHFEKYAPI